MIDFIELAKISICYNDTVKDYVKDGKLTITEEQIHMEIQRRQQTCFYSLKWYIMWKIQLLKVWWKFSILKSNGDND